MQEITVLFADLANSTRLYQTNGDVEAHRLISDSLATMKTVIEEHDGVLLRTVGDAVLASFDNTENAFHAAIGIQQAHQETTMRVRVGFHYGEVIPDKGDIYGNAVNIAARVASFAKADEIYTTLDCIERIPVIFRSKTEFLDLIDFKGIKEALAVHRVNWTDNTLLTEIATHVNRTARYSANQRLELICDDKKLDVSVSDSVVSFGRTEDNDVLINHESTSRNHASIEFVHGRFVLKDNSTNGTYVARPGKLMDFLRREELTLDQYGDIGFGWKPAVGIKPKISYRVVVEDSLVKGNDFTAA